MYSTGSITRNTFRNGPEVHKLHLEFTPKTGETIHRGQLVVLEADGTISGAAADADESTIIGVSIHEAVSAYGDLVVVAMRGFTVLEAVAGKVGVTAETDIPAVDAGPVAVVGYVLASDPTSASKPIEESTAGVRENNTLTTQGVNAFAGASAGATVIGWSLTQVAASVTAAQVASTIYGGSNILVVIKD